MDYQLTNIDILPIEQVEKPKIVYKYRSWNRDIKYDDMVLTHNQLYMSEPLKFKDKLDCRSQTRYDLMTDEEILNWSEKMTKRDHPRFNDEAIRKLAVKNLDRVPFKDEELMKKLQEDEWLSYNDWAGVLSLCVTSTSDAMWSEYGANHSGICYGFFTDDLIKGCMLSGGAKVEYVDELPVILQSMHPFVQSGLKAYYKLRNYEYEEEYRLRTFNPNNKDIVNRIKIYPNEVLAEVVFGKDFDKEQIKVIRGIIEKRNSKAVLYQCSISDSKLIRERLD
jgi:hypothetical protein